MSIDDSDWDCRSYWLGIKSEIFGDSKYTSYCRGRIADMEKLGVMAKHFFPHHAYELDVYDGIPINNWSRDITEIQRKYFDNP